MAWCDSLPAGAPIEQIEDLAESLIDRRETAPLHDIVPGKGAVIRDASGRIEAVRACRALADRLTRAATVDV